MTQHRKQPRELRKDASRRSAWLRPGGSAGLPISPGRRRPGESVYRHPQWVEREGLVVALIFGLMGVLLAGFAAICAYRSAHDQEISEAFVAWGGTSAILWPVTISAVIGGLTLNRYGWVVGLVFGAGFQLTVVGSVLSQPLTLGIGLALLVGAVPLFFVIGAIRRVPMWIGGRFGPRVVIDDGRAEGEDEPGHLSDR